MNKERAVNISETACVMQLKKSSLFKIHWGYPENLGISFRESIYYSSVYTIRNINMYKYTYFACYMYNLCTIYNKQYIYYINTTYTIYKPYLYYTVYIVYIVYEVYMVYSI